MDFIPMAFVPNSYGCLMIFLRVSGTTGPDLDPKAQMTRRVVISESFFPTRPGNDGNSAGTGGVNHQ